MTAQSARAFRAPAEPLMTARDVMARIGCSRSFVQDHKDELGGRKLGGLLKFERSEVEAWIVRGRTAPAAPEPVADTESAYRRPVLVHKSPINKLTGLPWGVYR